MSIKIHGTLESDSDIELTTVKDTVCKYFGYTETIFDDQQQEIPNPESKEIFVLRIATEYLTTTVYNENVRIVEKDARDNVVKIKVTPIEAQP